MRVKCLAQEHNTMSPAKETRTARSGVERTNYEATAPPRYVLRNCRGYLAFPYQFIFDRIVCVFCDFLPIKTLCYVYIIRNLNIILVVYCTGKRTSRKLAKKEVFCRHPEMLSR